MQIYNPTAEHYVVQGLTQRCTKLAIQFAVETKFCKAVPNIFGSSVCHPSGSNAFEKPPDF